MKTLFWTAFLAVIVPIQLAQAYHGGGGGGSHSGGGGGSHGSWGGGGGSHGSGAHGSWSGGGGSHGGWSGGGTVSHGGWNGGNVSHEGWHGDWGLHRGWGYGGYPYSVWGYGGYPYGGWYGGWNGGIDYSLSACAPPAVGAVVNTIPNGCQQFTIDGVPYYTINGVNYMQTADGSYQVVQPPQVNVEDNSALAYPTPPGSGNVPAPDSTTPSVTSAPVQNPAADNPGANVSHPQGTAAAQPENSFTFGIPNKQGGYTPITLKISGKGFIGPQGEFYSEFPKLELLEAIYGK